MANIKDFENQVSVLKRAHKALSGPSLRAGSSVYKAHSTLQPLKSTIGTTSAVAAQNNFPASKLFTSLGRVAMGTSPAVQRLNNWFVENSDAIRSATQPPSLNVQPECVNFIDLASAPNPYKEQLSLLDSIADSVEKNAELSILMKDAILELNETNMEVATALKSLYESQQSANQKLDQWHSEDCASDRKSFFIGKATLIATIVGIFIGLLSDAIL